MSHPAAFALLLLMAAALLGIGAGLVLLSQRITARPGPAAPGRHRQAPAIDPDDPGDWDEPTLAGVRDTGPAGRNLAGYLAAIDLQELQERCAETSEIAIVRALVEAEDFRSGLDQQAQLIMEHAYALLSAADIGIGLAAVGQSLS